MDTGSFDWNKLIEVAGNVAGNAVKKPDTYNTTYVTEADDSGNKLLIAGLIGIGVILVLKFLKK